LQKCKWCGRFRFPPSPGCYYCGKRGESWQSVSGKGVLYSWIVIHHPLDKRLANEVPFVVVLVELEEGPRMAGRLTGCDRNEINTGMPVKVMYDDVDDELTLVNFKPDIQDRDN
ncbi:MAG: OB-fold domain-containing protein, partial [Deltaproteobacteria bacterium]|nr:OB-fold domain-containing protein [Deltaproteobacteria bacterium]